MMRGVLLGFEAYQFEQTLNMSIESIYEKYSKFHEYCGLWQHVKNLTTVSGIVQQPGQSNGDLKINFANEISPVRVAMTKGLNF